MMGSRVNSTRVTMGILRRVIWNRSCWRLLRSSRKPEGLLPCSRYSCPCHASRTLAYQMKRNTTAAAIDRTLYSKISIELSPGNRWKICSSSFQTFIWVAVPRVPNFLKYSRAKFLKKKKKPISVNRYIRPRTYCLQRMQPVPMTRKDIRVQRLPWIAAWGSTYEDIFLRMIRLRSGREKRGCCQPLSRNEDDQPASACSTS